jgi:hypothetical protein
MRQTILDWENPIQPEHDTTTSECDFIKSSVDYCFDQ